MHDVNGLSGSFVVDTTVLEAWGASETSKELPCYPGRTYQDWRMLQESLTVDGRLAAKAVMMGWSRRP